MSTATAGSEVAAFPEAGGDCRSETTGQVQESDTSVQDTKLPDDGQDPDYVSRDQAVLQLLFTFPCSLSLVVFDSWPWLSLMAVAVLGPLLASVWVLLPATVQARDQLYDRLARKAADCGLAFGQDFKFLDAKIQQAYESYCLLGGSAFLDNVVTCVSMALPWFVASLVLNSRTTSTSTTEALDTVRQALLPPLGLLALFRGVLLIVFGKRASRTLNAVLGPLMGLSALQTRCWNLWDLPRIVSNHPIVCEDMVTPAADCSILLLAVAPSAVVVLVSACLSFMQPLVPSEGSLMPSTTFIVVWLAMTFWMSQDVGFMQDSVKQVAFHAGWSVATTVTAVMASSVWWRRKEESLVSGFLESYLKKEANGPKKTD